MSYRDLLGLGSLVAIAAGCWMAWPPLGLIVPGLIVFAAVASTHNQAPEGDE